MFRNFRENQNNIVELKANEQGHYTFNNSDIVKGKNTVFIDKITIAELKYDEVDTCTLTIFTKTQVNVFLDLKIDSFSITTKGSLLFISNLDIGKKLKIVAHSVSFIKSTMAANNAEIKISDFCGVDEMSVIKLNCSEIKSTTVENNGGLSLESSHLNTEILIQNNYFCAENSSVFVMDRLMAGNKSETQLNNCLSPTFDKESSAIKISTLNIRAGKLIIVKSNYNGNLLIGEACDICVRDDSLITLHQKMILDEKSVVDFEKTKIIIYDNINSNARIRFKDCVVVSNKSYNQYANSIAVVSSQLFIEIDFICNNGIDLTESKIKSKIMLLTGNVRASNSTFVATSSLKITSNTVSISKCNSESYHLTLQGMGKRGTYVISDSEFKTNLFTQDGRMEFVNHSKLLGCNETVSHEIFGKIKFIDSDYITRSSVYNGKSGKITLRNTANKELINEEARQKFLFVALEGVNNNGKIKIRGSAAAHTNSLVQFKGVLSVKESSSMVINGDMTGRSDMVKLNKASNIHAKNMYFDTIISTKQGGSLISDGYFYTSYSTKINGGSKFTIKSGIYISCGESTFDDPTIDTLELRIYNKFIVTNGKTTAGRVSIAASGQLEITDHSIKANRFESSGYFKSYNSNIELVKFSGLSDDWRAKIQGYSSTPSVNLFDNSQTDLLGRSYIKSSEIFIGGHIKSQVVNKDGQHLVPSLVGNELYTSHQSSIYGDAFDLYVEYVMHAGSIKLVTEFKGYGTAFLNTGLIWTGENISFGYDDSYASHGGSVSTKCMSVDSSCILNLSGSQNIEQQYSANCLIHANYGVSFIQNSSINALLSLRGLSLPNFSFDRKYIITTFIIPALKHALTYMFDDFKNTINTAYMTYDITKTGIKLSTLISRGFKYKENPIRRHEILSAVGTVKDAIEKVASIADSFSHTIRELENAIPVSNYLPPKTQVSLTSPSTVSTEIDPSGKTETVDIEFGKIMSFTEITIPAVKSLLKDTLSRVGSYNESALIGSDGFLFHPNIKFQHVLNSNKAINYAFNQHSIKSWFNLNSGMQFGQDFSIKSKLNINNGCQVGLSHFISDVESTHNGKNGVMIAHQYHIKGDMLHNSGSIKLADGLFDIRVMTGSGELHYSGLNKIIVPRFYFTGNITGAITPDGLLYPQNAIPQDVYDEIDEEKQKKDEEKLAMENAAAEKAALDKAEAEKPKPRPLTKNEMKDVKKSRRKIEKNATNQDKKNTKKIDRAQKKDQKAKKNADKHAREAKRLASIAKKHPSSHNCKKAKNAQDTASKSKKKQDNTAKNINTIKAQNADAAKKETDKKSDKAQTAAECLKQNPISVKLKIRADLAQFDANLSAANHEKAQMVLNEANHAAGINARNDKIAADEAAKMAEQALQKAVANPTDKQAEAEAIKAQTKAGAAAERADTSYKIAIADALQRSEKANQASANAKSKANTAVEEASKNPNDITAKQKAEKAKKDEAEAELVAKTEKEYVIQLEYLNNPNKSNANSDNPTQDSTDQSDLAKELPKRFNYTDEEIAQGYTIQAKPQHVFWLQTADKVILGEFSGGDAHIITGMPDEKGNPTKCSGIDFTSDQPIIWKNGHIMTEELNWSDDLTNLTFINMCIKVGILPNFSNHLKPVLIGKNYFEINSEFLDQSTLQLLGYSTFKCKKYSHDGNIVRLLSESADKASWFNIISEQKPELNGHSDIDKCYISVSEQFPDALDLVCGNGKYADYLFSKGLTLDTIGEKTFNQKNNRDCDIALVADSIKYSFNAKHNHKLHLGSKIGDVAILSKDLDLGDLSIHSAKDFYLNGKITIKNDFNFYAEGGAYNLGANVNADYIEGDAKEIKLYTAVSRAGKKYKGPFKMGKEGIFNARYRGLYEAREGNVENHGGLWRSGNYTQLISKNGHVIGIANEVKHKGKHDIIKSYDPALFIGGAGFINDNIGMFISAGGQLKLDASKVISSGFNIIHAKKGYVLDARYHTHIEEMKKHKDAVGFREVYKYKTKTNVYSPQISSEMGNMLTSKEGGARTFGAEVIGPTKIYLRDDGVFMAIRSKDTSYKFESKWWGSETDRKKQILENAKPTLFYYDDYLTSIHSKLGNLDFSEALIFGKGDFEFSSGKKTIFGRPILNNKYSQTKRGYTFSFPGMDSIKHFQQGNIGRGVSAMDATFAKLYTLSGSSNVAEFLSNASNVGIDLINTGNQFLQKGLDADLSSAILERYHLGGKNGFDPSIRLGMSIDKTYIRCQILGQGGVQIDGFIRGKAGEVILKNGVTVDGKKGVDIDTRVLTIMGILLKTIIDRTNVSGSIGVTASGEVLDAKLGFSHQHTSIANYINSCLRTNGTMYLHRGNDLMNKLNLYNGNIVTDAPEGGAKETTITDHQDVVKTTALSFSADTNGQLSFNHRRTIDKTINQHSGIETKGKGKFDLGEVTDNSDAIKDRHHKSAIGMSINIPDTVSPPSDGRINTLTIQRETDHTNISLDIPTSSLDKMKQAAIKFGSNVQHGMDAISNSVTPMPATPVDKATAEELYQPIDLTAKSNPKEFNQVLESLALPTIQGDIVDSKIESMLNPDVPKNEANYETFSKRADVFSKIADTFGTEALTSGNENINGPSKLQLEVDTLEDKSKIQKVNIKLKPPFVMVGLKEGRHSQQIFDIVSGRYINRDGIMQKIIEGNQNRRLLETEYKFRFKKELFAPLQEIYYRLDHPDKLIVPTLVAERTGYAILEFDPTKSHFTGRFTFDIGLRGNVFQNSYDTSMGNVSYAMDAASLQCFVNGTLNNNRGFDGKLHVELGVLGPNASASYKSPEICLFGIAIQFEMGGCIGFGAKAVAGGGVTLDKTKGSIRPYLKVGAFWGCGGEVCNNVNVSLDPDFYQRYETSRQENTKNLWIQKVIKQLNDELEHCNKVNFNSYAGAFFNALYRNNIAERLADIESRISSQALIESSFTIKQ